MISSHATQTIKKGRDLSTSTLKNNSERQAFDDLRKEANHSVKFVSDTI